MKCVRAVVNPVTGELCDAKDSVEFIYRFFTNIGPNLNAKLPPSINPCTISESGVLLGNIEFLSNEDVDKLVKNINIYKSSGLPDINSRLVKDAFLVLIEQLTFVLNLSLKTGTFPDAWKLATVTPIPKGGA